MKFIVFAFLLVFPFAALAGDRIALVIGNDRYANLRDLKNAGADADSVADALEALGFTVFRERNRDLRRMRRALEDMEHDGAGAEVALVYFAGHGFEVSGDNRLVPVDGDPATLKSLMDTSVSLGDVRDMVARIAEVGIVLIDACREDPLSASGAGRGGISLKGQVFQPGFASVEKTDGTLIGFATAPGDMASDGADGHSPFATALVRHLGVPGLEVRSVLTLVQQEVYDRTRGDQLPYVESALPRLFFAAQASDDLPERERLLLAMAGLSPDLRAEVEQAAAAGNMPLAPLYGAMIGAGLDKASASDRASKLADAARAYAQTRDRLRSFAAKDDEVTRLRDVAAQKLDLGDFTGAIAALDLAVERDRTSGERLESNLITRRLSEAESLALKAGVAETALDYDVAVAALGQAATLHARIAGLDVSDADRRKRTWLLADLGDLHVQLGNSGAAALRFSEMQLAAMARLERSSDNLEAERDLSVSHNRIGKVQVAQGDLPGARASYDAGLAIVERLAASDQGNAVWQRDLSVSHSRIGNVQVA
ncbi:MAG: caspase family protein, partial [Pseudooceanicola sp.]